MSDPYGSNPSPSRTLAWVPDACTLPTAEKPLRVAEFDVLFAHDLRQVREGEDRQVWMRFEDRPGLREDLASLTARETSCCSFFTFELDEGPTGPVLSVRVPAARVGVLAALADRARQLAGHA